MQQWNDGATRAVRSSPPFPIDSATDMKLWKMESSMTPSFSEMQTLMEGLTEEEVKTYGLVLLSAGIEQRSIKSSHGWELHVDRDAYTAAFELIRQYLHENRSFPLPRKLHRQKYVKTFSGLWGALVILAVHMSIAAGHDGRSFVAIYGASARLVLEGEWYRCITSLLLHADTVHLLGNIAGIGVFGTAACSLMGWGVGWAMILACGMLGNLVNALLYQDAHLSIGASTAVFGAVGLLSSSQFIDKIRRAGERYRAFLPIGAGLALLAFLGAAVRTDVMGHLFGFLSGLVLGGGYGLLLGQRILQRSYQFGALALTIALLVGSWYWPIK